MLESLVSLGLVALAIGAAVVFWRLRDWPRRQIEGQQITPVSALQEGVPARIRGVLAACEPLLTSKLGGQRCVGYQDVIFEPAPGDLDRERDRVWERTLWSSFLVTDETGTVAVEGQLRLVLDPYGGPQGLPPVGYPLLAEDRVPTKGAWGPRKFQFHEMLLRVGDRVSVVGRPTRVDGAAAGGSSPALSPAYAMKGTADEPVVVMDDDEVVRALVTRPPRLLPVRDPDEPDGPVLPRRVIADRPSIAVVALSEGRTAKLRGVVSAREALVTSPVSGRACVGYRIAIGRMGRGRVVLREAWPSFYLADGTGTIAVEGPFSILLDPDGAGWSDLPPPVNALLEEAGASVRDRLGPVAELQYHETLLEVGDRVGVYGRASHRIDPAGQGALRAPPRLYVLQGSEDAPVAVIDDHEPSDRPVQV